MSTKKPMCNIYGCILQDKRFIKYMYCDDERCTTIKYDISQQIERPQFSIKVSNATNQINYGNDLRIYKGLQKEAEREK
jgi:hypothetical protein